MKVVKLRYFGLAVFSISVLSAYKQKKKILQLSSKFHCSYKNVHQNFLHLGKFKIIRKIIK